MLREQLEKDAVARERAIRRHQIDYSKWDDLADDDDDDGNAGVSESFDQGVILEASDSWKELNRVLPFNRSASEALLETLTAGACTGSLQLSSMDSSALSAFSGMNSILSNLAVLQLPQRRLRQLLEPTPLSPWCRAIQRMGYAMAANPTSPWLVAGLGVGATLLSVARTAKVAVFVGADNSQPSLVRTLRDTLEANSVRVGFGSRPSPSNHALGSGSATDKKLKLQGLSSLRKAPEKVPCEGDEPLVFLERGSLETMTLGEDGVSMAQDRRFRALVLDPELFDDGLLGHRVLPSLRHAHKSLLLPGAKVFPRAANVQGMLIALKVAPRLEDACGLKFSAQGDRCGWSAASFESMRLTNPTGEMGGKGVAWEQLSETFDVWNFDFEDRSGILGAPSRDEQEISVRLTSTGTSRSFLVLVDFFRTSREPSHLNSLVITTGRVNAMVSWFELDLGEEGRIGNHPAIEQQYWGHCVHWIPPFNATPESCVAVLAKRSDTTTSFEVISSLREAANCCIGAKLKERHLGKVSPRMWETLGSRKIVTSCRDALGQAVRTMQMARRDPRARGVHALEVQCGYTCGLMSMMAVRVGATKVTACDTNPTYVEASRELAAANGMESAVTISSTHPSKLNIGDDEMGLCRPVDLLLLPLPEEGLFEGGVLKLIKTLQQNSGIIARDAVVFPAKVTIWAQLVELKSSLELGGGLFMDCSAPRSLASPLSFTAPPPVDLAHTPHKELCAPVRMVTVDLADAVHGTCDPGALFEAQAEAIVATSSGFASCVAWWWSIDLNSDTDSQKLGNAPGSTQPWLQVPPSAIIPAAGGF